MRRSSIRYDGFISYSHLNDRPIAAALQSTMQKLGKPWYSRRALRVFRDDTSLSATPSLWPGIESALQDSRYLILLASPDAAASKWVYKEVSFWLENKSADSLLIGITCGDVHWDDREDDFSWQRTNALPPLLKGRFATPPRWIDLRPFRNAELLRDRSFVDACANFAAALHGRPKEDLLSEELREQRRALILARSAASALLLLVGLLAWQWHAALDAQRLAQIQRDRAENTLAATTGMANDLILNVAVRIRNRLGIPVSLVRDILTRSRDLLDKLLEPGEISPELRQQIALALRELATTSLIQGDITTALDSAERSRAIVAKLLSESESSPRLLRELSLSYNRLGEARSRAGQREEALFDFRQAFDLRRRLVDLERRSPESRRDLALSYERIGGELLRLTRVDEAADSYRDGMKIREELRVDFPDRTDSNRDMAVSYEKIGDVAYYLEDYSSALEHYTSSLNIRLSLVGPNPTDGEARRDLAITFAKIGDVKLKTGEQHSAMTAYLESLKIREELAASDPGNATWQTDLAIILVKVADGGDLPTQRYQRAREIGQRLDAEGKLGSDQRNWLFELDQETSTP